MSLVANYASDSDDNSSSDTEAVVQAPVKTASNVRGGIAAALPPPKKLGTSDSTDTLPAQQVKAPGNVQENKQARKVKIVVPLPDRHELSEEEDDTNEKSSAGQGATSSASSTVRSSLSSFLPAPKNQRPSKALGQAGSSARHEQLGKAMGEDAQIITSALSTSQDTAGVVENETTLHSMIPNSLRKRQQKTPSSKAKDTEIVDLFSLGALEESESREYNSTESTIKPLPTSSAYDSNDGHAVDYNNYNPAYTAEGGYTYNYATDHTATDVYGNNEEYNDQVTLSDEAIAALSGKRKRQYDFNPVNVNVVDVNLADRLGGYGQGGDAVNMAEHSATQINRVAGQNKRQRHNIMYLGSLASNYEQAFEERAALGRKNRRETAAKYGFR